MSDMCPCCRQTLPDSSDLLIDESGILVRAGRFAALTQQELAVFHDLHRAKGKVRSKEALHGSLYQLRQEDIELKIIDVFVCKLRRKLKPIGVEIQTVWGQGYRLIPVAVARDMA